MTSTSVNFRYSREVSCGIREDIVRPFDEHWYRKLHEQVRQLGRNVVSIHFHWGFLWFAAFTLHETKGYVDIFWYWYTRTDWPANTNNNNNCSRFLLASPSTIFPCTVTRTAHYIRYHWRLAYDNGFFIGGDDADDRDDQWLAKSAFLLLFRRLPHTHVRLALFCLYPHAIAHRTFTVETR